MAIRGVGATCNGQKIGVAQRARADMVLAASFPYVDEHNYGWCDPAIARVWPEVMEVRYMGSAALDLAYTAAGIFDGAFFRRVGWWDIAAGTVLIQEAGGLATDYTGALLTPDYQSFVAGAPFFVEWFCKNNTTS
jgi:myo-inositol-1(or 4)-monophosphatase